ncbi:low molecular weight phosphotyrosine protein phosphatase [Tritrichomonas foetus]|uniref:Low molecular weight phosphotyrosine protein phosphatase n=1 Tax=Tritrichomonas foetus TaxID=1144522 RepID=A0A1J4L2X9_9EUKA|nr:low molecular weight phosphotyrosine protein phosphatase [Tritrichomonas foetus]|eukprot:OHT16269.1 low molecular weight phosphotyrosine protein phosphatase [Tritrichomonas foetus]
MTDKKSILFVCLGNICRSPCCEGICRQVSDNKLTVDSASTSPVHLNECPDQRAIDICSKHGVDIRDHHAKQMCSYDWDRFDVVVALDESAYKMLNESKPSHCKAIVVLFNPPNGIADPYYGGRVGFQKMYDQISEHMKPFLIEHGLIEEST